MDFRTTQTLLNMGEDGQGMDGKRSKNLRS